MADETQQDQPFKFFTATKLVAEIRPSVVRGYVVMSLGHKDDIPDVNSLTVADAIELASRLVAAAAEAEVVAKHDKPVT